MELDEVEIGFYGTDSIDDLSYVFQQMALSPPSMSPAQISQRALNESVEFITSTLQRCRDIHGHTSSLSRQARMQAFLQRVQSFHLQSPVGQRMASTTPRRQNQMNPRYSRESNDSAIASFTESDIDVDTFWESDQNCSNVGHAALGPIKSMALSKDNNVQLGKTHFSIYVVTNSRPVVFSSTQAGSPLDLPRPGPRSLSTSTASCLFEGICSLCHKAEFRPLEAHVDQ